MYLILWLMSLLDLCETEEDPMVANGGSQGDPDG